MYFYLYCTTNKINNKQYIGVHECQRLVNDNYLGSGKRLKAAIKKYGVDKFEKQILEFFDTREAMYQRETEIVNEDFLKRDDVYNLNVGGDGGFNFINENSLNWSIEKNNRISPMTKPNWKKKFQTYFLTHRNKLSHPAWNKGLPGLFKGCTHTQEAREKISLARKGKGLGNQHRARPVCNLEGIQFTSIINCARSYKVTDTTIYNWIKQGKIRYTK